VIANLTTDMHTTCMGRFVIDLPQGMNTRGGYVILYYGLDRNFKTVEVTIQNTDTTPQKMADSIAAQAAKIAEDDNWETKKSMLLEHRMINEYAIYLRYQESFASAVGIKRELYLLMGKTLVKLHAESYEGLRDDPSNPIEPGEKVDERLFKLASQIRAYDDAEKAGPGFCLGQVVIDSDHDEESSHVSFSMPQYPDLSFTSDGKALTPDNEEPPLLQRMQKVSGRSDVHMLRKGEVTLGGMRAQEWLASGSTIMTINSCFLPFNPCVRSRFARPQMSFSLKAGGQLRGSRTFVNSSFTPGEGLAMWDAIIKSVRPRPNAVAPRSADKSAQ